MQLQIHSPNISLCLQTLVIQPTLDHRWDLTFTFDTLLDFVAHPVADPKSRSPNLQVKLDGPVSCFALISLSSVGEAVKETQNLHVI